MPLLIAWNVGSNEMKKLRNIILLILISLITVAIGLLGYRNIRQNQILNNTKLVCETCIDTLLTFNINSTKLTGLIRSHDNENPLLLFVHGGPGISDMPFARIFDSLLVKDFICVHYDQRGTGKSYLDNDLYNITIEDNINDLIVLAKEIKGLYPSNELILVGQSWGTLISALAIHKEPSLFDKYIGIGQIVNLNESDLISYDYALQKAKEYNDKESIELLTKIDRNDYNKNYKSLICQRRVLSKVGGRFFNKDIKTSLIETALFSPEYSIKELFQINKSSKLLDKNLYEDMLNYDLFSLIDSFPIPSYFIAGKYDYQTPTPIVEEYFNSLINKDKGLFLLKKSGHIPNYEEPKMFYDIVMSINKITTANTQ